VRVETPGPNHLIVTLNDDTEVLFSYDTPVAGYIGDRAKGVSQSFFKSTAKHSVTTSRHVSKYLADRNASASDQVIFPMPQAEIEALVDNL
jgi:hypothetical protein